MIEGNSSLSDVINRSWYNWLLTDTPTTRISTLITTHPV